MIVHNKQCKDFHKHNQDTLINNSTFDPCQQLGVVDLHAFTPEQLRGGIFAMLVEIAMNNARAHAAKATQTEGVVVYDVQ